MRATKMHLTKMRPAKMRLTKIRPTEMHSIKPHSIKPHLPEIRTTAIAWKIVCCGISDLSLSMYAAL
ncbi:hypothetical protein H8K27_08970 [Undibacterium sp. FT31W]|uniref:Uncharacterized protein n=1 Tax=Undibacterium griseum TaxID=2762295 RepID=A0ABR6YMY2_9BURK|nr:hypothetical protein [Undibacterium griseum]